ncbi:xylulokinase [Sinomicrobium soli]|uniref:xylulokinase n=1 Tax=Sinomicrobium sp. N-1-3-6 TaxID=2219864 RepID=UPI000DCAECB5|nr:FGGY family carbohydrate kinase [Sinomicrobium sp. N-1-3-6]RAV29632.1 carbohydrate kinase [Sinomicrobium sp. N-1-3-6]
MYWIGYDVGSSSVKAALVKSGTGEVVGTTRSPEEEMAITSKRPGWGEQDPEMWWDHLVRATSRLLRENNVGAGSVKGIGVSYQMHGLVLVDRQQQVLRDAIIWCDSRAVVTGRELLRTAGERRCIDRLLNTPGNFTLSRLKWVQENEPGIYAKVYRFLLPGDFIAMKLTGRCTTTPSGLSEGIAWDFKENKPALWLLEQAGIDPAFVPEVVPTFAEQGRLTSGAASELGLMTGIPLLYRAGDQPNNALSLNVMEPGEIAATGGTSGVVYAVSDTPHTTEGIRTNNFAHVNHTPEHPRIGKLLNINGAGILYRWMRDQVSGEAMSYEAMNQLAGEVPAGSGGLLVLPFGNGAERMLGNVDAGASVLNLNFNIHERKHLYRAALEGIAFSFVYGMEILRNDGVNLTAIRAGGDNLFRSGLFSRTIATLVGTEIRITDTTGAVGAARAAGYGSGDFKDLREAFAKDRSVAVYHPEKEGQTFIDAYGIWKEVLKRNTG